MKMSMNLHQKPTGVYYVIFRDSKGKQRWKSLGTKNKGEATRLYNHFKRAYLQGKLRKLEEKQLKVTLKDFTDEYLEYMSDTRTYNTYRDARAILTIFINYVSSAIYLSEIKRKDIDGFISYCLNELKNKPVSINKKLRTLKATFNVAISWEYLKVNPIANKQFLKLDQQQPRFLAREEYDKILSSIDNDEFRYYIEICFNTGCRRNEVLDLEWKDIDFEKDLVIIRKSKSHYSREIPISLKLKEILLDMKGNVNKIGKLFPNFKDNFVTKNFKNYASQAGVNCKLHDLRHTFATYLVNKNVSIKVLQSLLGHRSINSTLVYAHTMDEAKKEAIELLNKR